MSSEETVLQELKNIYHPDHLKKNAFFREMLEQDPERCKCPFLFPPLVLLFLICIFVKLYKCNFPA